MDKHSLLLEIFLKLRKVSTDSRLDVGNSIFFALSGENFDGNKFAKNAIENGASLAVIDKEEFKIDDNYLVVDDVLLALLKLAHNYRKTLTTTILAITGSNGKTTTKELVYKVLASEKDVYATKGNFNNHIGVPLSLLSIKDNTEIAIIEMGANHIGEIKTLCDITLPNFGIITNIGKAHLEGFGSFAGVIKAKSELYDSIKQGGGNIIVNNNDQLLIKLSEGIPSFTYGDNNSDVNGNIVKTNPFIGLVWSNQSKKEYSINTNLYGTYNMPNIMAAIACGIFFKVSEENICKSIEEYSPTNNRSQIIKTDKNSIVLDAYNANPVSMKNAIISFAEHNSDNPVLILGDMFELGESSLEEHQTIIDQLKQSKFTDVFLVGEEFYKLSENQSFKSFKTTKDAANYLSSIKLANHSILIKGSRGMKLEELVELF